MTFKRSILNAVAAAVSDHRRQLQRRRMVSLETDDEICRLPTYYLLNHPALSSIRHQIMECQDVSFEKKVKYVINMSLNRENFRAPLPSLRT
ncbi:hypothetical protein AB4851_29140 [Burkholderia sp. 22PA0099]|uniref:hypothetical protein n=1 Tax=Burkholderia sp. 22PA0099 TaxID=3237372 RepID=UPI0039C49A9E